MNAAYDLMVAGRPSVDVMFSGLREWPQLGNDIESDGFGWCAGTSFNTPAAAIQQSDAKRMFHVGHRLGYDRLRHRELRCGLSHGAGLHHGQQNMQVP